MKLVKNADIMLPMVVEVFMAKVLEFKIPTKVDAESMKLLKISDEIDAVILRHLAAGEVEPHEIAGLLAHRLGNLMKHIGGEEKMRLWQICSRIIGRQAEVDNVV
jgi:hypothetical protein